MDAKESKTLIGGLKVEVVRNYFGSQIDSFETEVNICMEGHVHKSTAVFIRAPVVRRILESDSKVKVLCSVPASSTGETLIVGVEQGNILGICYHPELTEELKYHAYFIRKVLFHRNLTS